MIWNATLSVRYQTRLLANHVPLELDDAAEVTHDELWIVAARVDVELVRHAARVEELVQLLGAALKSIIIVVADVEVDLQAFEIGGRIVLGEGEDIIAIEVGAVHRRAEHSHCARLGAGSAAQIFGQLRHECRHLRAYRREFVGILEGQAQRTVSTHRDAGNAAEGIPSSGNPHSEPSRQPN